MKKLTDLTFMIVDDMPNMRRTVRSMLTRMGIRKAVIEADDGDRAWEKLQYAPIDFIICDWNMPRMKGIELLRKMRKDPKYESVPFLMLTAEVEEGTIAQAAETEIDAYLIKPFVMKTLMDKIDEAMRRRFEPTEAEILFRKSTDALKTGQLKVAYETLQKVLELSPNSAKVHRALGEVFLEGRNVTKAKESFEKAISLSRQYTKALDGLATVYGMEGDLGRQEELLHQAVEISPMAPDRQLQYGKALLAVGKEEEAINALETSLKQDPESPELARAVGEVFLAADLDQYATKAFKKAINLMPNEIHTYNRLGIALRKQKKYLEAIQEYQKALQKEPENEVILYNISIAYYNQGLKQEAKTTLEKLLKINPNHGQAMDALKSL